MVTIRAKKFSVFAGANRPKLIVDVGECHAGELGFHAGLGFDVNVLQDRADSGADGAPVVGGEVVEAATRALLDGAIDVAKRDVFRGAGE
jgi:hypothetical protein